MVYDLNEINLKTVQDPKAFCEECEERYNGKVREAAEKICGNLKNSPIILLSGPSGSGKTTTARKVGEELSRKGIRTHYVSMDDYFKKVGEGTPRTPEGGYDLESPLCMDIDLLNEHFTALSKGESVNIPKYDFLVKDRAAEPSKTIRLGKDEMCIFEGIHALNSALTGMHTEAFRLFISPRTNVEFNGDVVFKATWFRLVRRTVRDYKFRNSDAEETMSMWANIRRGEKLYISPFRETANFWFDTSMPCELAVMNETATKLFRTVPEGVERYDELRKVLPALQLFGRIDEKAVPEDSLLREFIGGSNN